MSIENNPIPSSGVLKSSQDSFTNKEGFDSFNSYSKNYVVLTSDRLILNSKDDSIFLTSKRTIGLSANEQLHINIGPLGKRDPSKHYVVINSPLIQLGLPRGDKNDNNEPVAKAHSTIQYVNGLIKALGEFCNSLTPAKGIGGPIAGLPEINAAAMILKAALIDITNRYGNINSSPIPSKITKTL